jgi:hypothetical protein
MLESSWADICDDEEDIPEDKPLEITPHLLLDDDSKWTTVSVKKKKVCDVSGNKKVCIRNKCKNTFIFTLEESEEFKQKGWKPRSVCNECKKKKNK